MLPELLAAETAYLQRFDPHRDKHDWVIEDPFAYAARMQESLLPNWPTEVLVEWLHRHNRHADRYAFLRFEALRFRKETVVLEKIPGREVFYDPKFCDDFTDIKRRAQGPHDWLAKYMLENGTWNTPVILLENPDGAIAFPNGEPFKRPHHLLEGHRRLSFLNGLRIIKKAKPSHDVWVVSLSNSP